MKAAVWEGLVSIGWTSRPLTLATAVSREEETRRSSVLESTVWAKVSEQIQLLLVLSGPRSGFEPRGWVKVVKRARAPLSVDTFRSRDEQRQLGHLKPVTCVEVFLRNDSSVSRFV